MSSQRRLQDTKEGFRPVLQITIARWNLAPFPKPTNQKLQEGVLGKRVENYTYKSISGAISKNRGLRIESEDNEPVEKVSFLKMLHPLDQK